MKFSLFSCLLTTSLILTILPVSAEPRTFTDQQGRKIEAEIVAVAGSKVTLRLTNGKKYTIPIKKLSKGDQVFVEVWGEMDQKSGGDKKAGTGKSGTVIPEGGKYEITFDVDKKRTRKGSKVEVETGEMKTDEWTFEIELENSSKVDLEGLEMSYRIYVDPEASKKMTFDSPPKYYGGRLKVKPVADGATVKVATGAVPLKELELGADYVFKDGSKNKLDDKLEGIWIKLWHGEKKVAEFKSNKSTVKKAQWADTEAADPNAEPQPEPKPASDEKR